MKATEIARLMLNMSLILDAIHTHQDLDWTGLEAERDRLSETLTQETMAMLNAKSQPEVRQMTIDEIILPEEPEVQPVVQNQSIPKERRIEVSTKRTPRFDTRTVTLNAIIAALRVLDVATAADIVTKARELRGSELEGIDDDYIQAKLRDYAYKNQFFGTIKQAIPESEWGKNFGHKHRVYFYLLEEKKPEKPTQTNAPEVIKLNGKSIPPVSRTNRNGKSA